MNLTDLEKGLIHLMDSEYCYGGNFIYFDEYDMKKMRGVISSLIKKKIIEIDWANSSAHNNDISDPNSEYIWVCLTDFGIELFPDEESVSDFLQYFLKEWV